MLALGVLSSYIDRGHALVYTPYLRDGKSHKCVRGKIVARLILYVFHEHITFNIETRETRDMEKEIFHVIAKLFTIA